MNLLNLLREKCRSLPSGFDASGIEAVILHIERAEKYWVVAKQQPDKLLFTDVIYRTNQAFEGMLKEAYAILAKKESTNIPSYKIEAYFIKSNLFKERVLTAFTHYRTEWRNEATHNYKLFFSEQEALLAINSVSTFCLILLDQINIRANANFEREHSRQFSATVKNSIKSYKSLDFHSKIANLLQQSYRFLKYPLNRLVSEYEFIGLLEGFIEAVDSTIHVESEVLLSQSSSKRADLVCTKNNEKVIIKVRRFFPIKELSQDAKKQLLYEMSIADVQYGILMTIDEKAISGDKRILKLNQPNSPIITFINPDKYSALL